MIITVDNANTINTPSVCLHDSVFEDFHFNRDKKELYLKLLKEDFKSPFTIIFYNVVGFEMTSCDFWGASPHVLDFEYVTPQHSVIIPKAMEECRKYNLPLFQDKSFFETIITFTSGDTLSVACERILI